MIENPKPMEFTLWPACVKTHPFEQQVKAAAAGGFDTLAISPLTWKTLRSEGWTPERIRSLPREYGVRLNTYDGFTDWAPLRYSSTIPEAARAIFDVSVDECLEICAALELNSICATGAFAVGECELDALQSSFARFAERAAEFHIRVDLEFLPMWGIPDLRTAWDIIAKTRPFNAGILLDTWHFMRGNPDIELLEQLPRGSITSVQVADADHEVLGADLFEDTLRYRRLPGDGDLPLRQLMDIVLPKGGVRSIGPEIYADALDKLEADEAARLCSSATRALLE